MDPQIENELEIEGVPPETPPAGEKSAEDLAYEDRARRMGWREKDAYGGDKSRWVDARTFVERGETELPILRERFRKLDDRLAKTESELTDTKKKLTESTQVLVELRDMSIQAQERGFQQAMASLRDRERKAVAEADTATYEQLQQEKNQLEQTRPKAVAAPVPPTPPTVPVPPAPPQIDPAIQAWIAENSWFNTDRILNSYALAEDSQVQQEFPHWPMADKLAEVKKRVVARFPEKFGVPPRREAPPPVAVNSAPPPKTKGKTVRDLPADARKHLERFKKQIPGYKDEDYLKLYFGDEA